MSLSLLAQASCCWGILQAPVHCSLSLYFRVVPLMADLAPSPFSLLSLHTSRVTRALRHRLYLPPMSVPTSLDTPGHSLPGPPWAFSLYTIPSHPARLDQILSSRKSPLGGLQFFVEVYSSLPQRSAGRPRVAEGLESGWHSGSVHSWPLAPLCWIPCLLWGLFPGRDHVRRGLYPCLWAPTH